MTCTRQFIGKYTPKVQQAFNCLPLSRLGNPVLRTPNQENVLNSNEPDGKVLSKLPKSPFKTVQFSPPRSLVIAAPELAARKATKPSTSSLASAVV